MKLRIEIDLEPLRDEGPAALTDVFRQFLKKEVIGYGIPDCPLRPKAIRNLEGDLVGTWEIVEE